jgi:hypothetical protein
MKANIRILIPLSFLTLLLSAGCASTQLILLDRTVASADKSKMLSDAGIRAYNERLVRDGDLTQIEAVKSYFINALRFDPGNDDARRYLDLASGFKAARLQSVLKDAQDLAKKRDRSEDETYRLCVLLKTANEIDSQNPDLKKLEDRTADARSAFAKSSRTKAEAALAERDKTSAGAKKRSLSVSAYNLLSRACTASPSNLKARALRAQTKGQLAGYVQEYLDAASGYMDQGSYTKAKGKIDAADSLSASAGGIFDDRVRKSYHNLYFTWATYFYDKGDYAHAEVRINAALSAQKSVSAQDLRKRILDRKVQEDKGATFEEGAENAERLIRRGALLRAYQTLNALAPRASDKESQTRLADLRSKLQAAMADQYARGVAAYQAERFDDAIDALDDIVSIEPGYQQASDYLEKARANQKTLLESS